MEQTIWEDTQIIMYVKSTGNISSFDFLEGFIFGIKAKTSSWVSQEPLKYSAEDGFQLQLDEFLPVLKQQVDNYTERQIKIEDQEQDTNGWILFDCKNNKVEVSGELGNTIDDTFQLKFKFEATSQILINLYNVLNNI